MKESEMEYIAELVKRVVIGKEPLENVRADAAEFRKAYQRVQFCFENSTEAYKYIKIR
jgi:glycine/serine hydroxymethyltransferase